MIQKFKLSKVNIEKAVTNAVEASLEGLGAIGVTTARLMAPVDTGLLSNSITWATKQSRGDAGTKGVVPTDKQTISTPDKKFELFVGTNVEYAPYMEIGSDKRNVTPNPFILPARVKIQKTIDNGYIAKKIMQEFLKNG